MGVGVKELRREHGDPGGLVHAPARLWPQRLCLRMEDAVGVERLAFGQVRHQQVAVLSHQLRLDQGLLGDVGRQGPTAATASERTHGDTRVSHGAREGVVRGGGAVVPAAAVPQHDALCRGFGGGVVQGRHLHPELFAAGVHRVVKKR